MTLPRILFGLDTALGSRFAEVSETAEGLMIRSTNVGFLWLVVIALALAGLAILIHLARKGFEARVLRDMSMLAGVLAVCGLIVAVTSYSETRVMLVSDPDPPRIVVERRGLLGDLWVGRESLLLAELLEVGVGTGTIKAATRNGTPQGPDRTGYHLRLRPVEGRSVEATPTAVGGLSEVIAAGRLLQERINLLRPEDPVSDNFKRFSNGL
jgi:hypothetical protein